MLKIVQSIHSDGSTAMIVAIVCNGGVNRACDSVRGDRHRGLKVIIPDISYIQHQWPDSTVLVHEVLPMPGRE